MLYQWMLCDPQRGELCDGRGGVHEAEGTNFACMKEYQAVTLKLSRRVQDDDDALTDLLNERSRAGWGPALISQGDGRLIVVFHRLAGADS